MAVRATHWVVWYWLIWHKIGTSERLMRTRFRGLCNIGKYFVVQLAAPQEGLS
jgi:hypothetical protein